MRPAHMSRLPLLRALAPHVEGPVANREVERRHEGRLLERDARPKVAGMTLLTPLVKFSTPVAARATQSVWVFRKDGEQPHPSH